MKRTMILASVLTALALGCAKAPDAPSAQPAQPSSASSTPPTDPGAMETLTVDPAASHVDFVAAKITRTHNGGFRDVSGRIDFDPANVLRSRIQMRVETASLFADVPRLEQHLKSPDFFDVARFPEATFRSTSIALGGANGATHTVTGDLTIHGHTKSLALPVTIEVDAGAVTARSEVTLDRRDFGLVYPGMPDDLIRDEVVLRISLRAPRTES